MPATEGAAFEIDPAVHDRARAAYLGLALGDALGATVEFMTPREIQATHGVHREIRGGGWLKLPRGAVTDDTTMSLALGEALIEAADRPDALPRAIGDAFVRWMRSGPVDCGNTCRRGIRRYLADGSFEGPPSEGDGGNGALMRNLPVALACLYDDARYESWSLLQARMTHHHPLSDAATLGFGHLVRAAVRGEPWPAVRARAEAFMTRWPVFRCTPWPRRASGYVVDTVQTVLHHVLGIEGFEPALVAVVNCGDDADTTGALAGMLLGAQGGCGVLPLRWWQALDPAVARAIDRQVEALLALNYAPDAAPNLHGSKDRAP